MNVDLPTLVAVVAIFLVAHVILKYTFFDPLLAIIDRREERVETAQQIYDRARTEAERRLADERSRLNEARLEVAEQRQALRRQADEARRETVEEAKARARARLDEVDSELSEQLEHERHVLDAKARDLADKMVERLVGRSV